jgi:hypothetical protein
MKLQIKLTPALSFEREGEQGIAFSYITMVLNSFCYCLGLWDLYLLVLIWG